MALPTCIVDGAGKGNLAGVSNAGELFVAPISYNVGKFQLMNTTTAFNFIEPIAGTKIVLSGFIINADKAVGAGNALVDIYTSSVGPTSLSITSSNFSIEMVKQTQFGLMGLNVLTDAGVWVNGKTDDANIRMTIFYYHISDKVTVI